MCASQRLERIPEALVNIVPMTGTIHIIRSGRRIALRTMITIVREIEEISEAAGKKAEVSCYEDAYENPNRILGTTEEITDVITGRLKTTGYSSLITHKSTHSNSESIFFQRKFE